MSEATPGAGSGGLDLDEVARVVVQLSQLADAIGSALSAQLTGGRHLVEALSDQLADGQVETLYTLQTAASALRQRAGEVVALTDELTSVADVAVKQVSKALSEDLAERLAQVTAVLEQGSTAAVTGVAARLVQQVAGDADALAARVTEQVESSGAALRETVDAGLERISASLGETHTAVTDMAAASALRVEEAEQSLTWAAGALDSAVAKTGVTLGARTRELDDVLRDAGTASAARLGDVGRLVMHQVEAAGRAAEDGIAQATFEAEARLTAAREQLVGTAEQAVDGIERAGRAMAEEITSTAQAFLSGLTTRVKALEKRDATLDARLEDRVALLVQTSEARLVAATERLEREADRLGARDEQLERQRAEEFVRVLDDVLSRAGAKGRDLRGRVLGVLERRPAPAAPPPAAPTVPRAPEPAAASPARAPALAADAPAPAKAAAANRPATVRKAAPAKTAAPAKKAAPKAVARKAAPAAPATPIKQAAKAAPRRRTAVKDEESPS